ncbi:replication fork protection component Swi3-domain-containing protein [Fennellomyces sp. T-0311]|nr:replication fork protection component Swi3-domain-containing protein [Fennellomyces sp. T-0311]
MDIDELDNLLLDDYDPFPKATANEVPKDQDTIVFDPLASTSGKRSEDGLATTSKRRKFKKLDADVLLDEKGLARLRHETVWLNFQGKGHEDEDLRKLMDYYTVWAHSLYPRLQIRDFSRMVTKATAQPRVKYALKQWQDEYYEKQSALNDNPAETNRPDEEDEDDAESGHAEETNVPLDTNSNSENDDSDDDNDLFLDYLTGVRTTVDDDTPPTITQASQNEPSPVEFIRSEPEAMQPEPSLSKTMQSEPVQADPMETEPFQGPKSDDDDDDEEPLFLNRKSKRRITDDDDE